MIVVAEIVFIIVQSGVKDEADLLLVLVAIMAPNLDATKLNWFLLVPNDVCWQARTTAGLPNVLMYKKPEQILAGHQLTEIYLLRLSFIVTPKQTQLYLAFGFALSFSPSCSLARC